MKKFYLLIICFFAVITILSAQKIHAVKPDMVYIEGGTFQMGSNKENNVSTKPVHSVTVSSFSICTHEVTRAEYKAFCLATGRPIPDAPKWGWNNKHPMGNVSWNDAVAYCNWLNEELKGNYRLPTEAEWEFAARGGNKSKGYLFAGSNDLYEVGWFINNSASQTNSVMTKKPNELGLYDMSGNVWEWCSDWYAEDYYSYSPSLNPKGAVTGDYKVIRGSSWSDGANNTVSIADRMYCSTVKGYGNFGFRVAASNYFSKKTTIIKKKK